MATKSLNSAVLPIDGEIPFVRMPMGEYSAARCRVIISTAPLLAPYHVRPVVGSSVMQELMLMILPDFFSRKCGTIALVAWYMLLTLMLKTPKTERLVPGPNPVTFLGFPRTVVFRFGDRQGILSAICPTGIIDENIDASKRGLCDVESSIPILALRHVHLDEFRIMVVGAQLINNATSR